MTHHFTYKVSSYIMILLAVMAFAACDGKKEEKSQPKPLNISIYLDLSNRLVIQEGLTPDQKTRDINIIDIVSDYFTTATQGPTILSSKNKMKILFYPAPKDKEINTLASNLVFDIASYSPGEMYDSLQAMKEKFHNSLTEIYNLTLKEQKWVGSDIWGFFSDKSKVNVQCIDKDARNIVIILTDGFLYQRGNAVKNAHEYSYILAETLNDPQSSLIVKNDGLEDIEVLVLELAPAPKDKDKMVSLITDWFTAMGVQKVETYETDVTTNIKTAIEKFLNNN